MPRVLNPTAAFNDRPFVSEGWSLYATVGTTVRYRRLCVVGSGRRRRPRTHIKGTAGVHDLAAASVLKTARVATGSGSPLTYALPAALASQTVTFDVRHWADDVECETDNARTARVDLSAARADATQILGTAYALAPQVRSGGIVRVRAVFVPARTGTTVAQFRLLRTAGPSSPAAVVQTWNGRDRLIEIDTPALLDSAPYTYTLRAENSGATITADLLTGLSIQADASGPPAPTAGSAVPC
jgi:hypothetical protein